MVKGEFEILTWWPHSKSSNKGVSHKEEMKRKGRMGDDGESSGRKYVPRRDNSVLLNPNLLDSGSKGEGERYWNQ